MGKLSAKEQHDRQRHYDRLHHLSRLAWLSQPAPSYSCGTPVSGCDVLKLSNGSKDCLALIEQHGMSTNSVGLDDVAYLAELDAFATTLH
jgi:hypothetical protein